MDYFEKRKLFNQSFKSMIASTGLTPSATNFNPYFLLREHQSIEEPVSTGKLDNAVELSEIFLGHVKKIKAKSFVNKIKKTLLKYSTLLNLDISFYDYGQVQPSLEIELNPNHKDLLDIENIGFLLRGEGVKTGFTTFRFFAHLHDVEASYEITQLKGKILEDQSFVDIHVYYKKADDIIIPMLNAYTDIVSQLVGYEVTTVDKEIITLLDMIKI